MVLKLQKHLHLVAITTIMVFSAPGYAMPEQALVPGGVAIIELDDYTANTRITFNDKKTTIFKHQQSWFALAGIPLKAEPGAYRFKIRQQDGSTDVRSVDVKAKKYKEQRLTIKNKRKVNPNLQDMERIAKERVRKRAAKNHWSDNHPDVDFIWPVTGRISSIFGLRRFFN